MRRSEFREKLGQATCMIGAPHSSFEKAVRLAEEAGARFDPEPDVLEGLRVVKGQLYGSFLQLGDDAIRDAALAEVVRRCEAAAKAVVYLEGADRFAKEDIIMNLRALLGPRQ